MPSSITSLFGIIGYPLTQSFSPTYFTQKFEAFGIAATHQYVKFEIANIEALLTVLQTNPQLVGLNVTSPYKQQVLQYVHEQDASVQACGAANTLSIRNGYITAYNTDVIGFQQSLLPLLQTQHTKALILGTGGASKAVAFVLSQLNIEFVYVSRSSMSNGLTYDTLTADHFKAYTVIVNCTPLGMIPNEATFPPIPYEYLTKLHLCYDLVYKPEQTIFLQKSAAQGAATKNGFDMLISQAEAAWKIWQG